MRESCRTTAGPAGSAVQRLGMVHHGLRPEKHLEHRVEIFRGRGRREEGFGRIL